MSLRRFCMTLFLAAVTLAVTGCDESPAEKELKKREQEITTLRTQGEEKDKKIIELTEQVSSYKVKDVSEEAKKLAADKTAFERKKEEQEKTLMELSTKAGELKNKQDTLDDMLKERDKANEFNKYYIIAISTFVGLVIVGGIVGFVVVLIYSKRKSAIIEDNRNRLIHLRDVAERLLEAIKVGASVESIAAFGKSAREISAGITQLGPEAAGPIPEKPKS